MRAVVYHGVGDIRLESVSEPKIKDQFDAIVQLTASAICGTDLHFVRGTIPGMKPGTILGHEGVGIVAEVGRGVRNFRAGDRVIIPSTIACGYCSYCRAGYYSQCDFANPNGKNAGTCFFGGPKSTGPIHGLQAERARVPNAHVNLVRLPDSMSDDRAILISDIFPTGFFAADLADIDHGRTVAVFGCGPVGQFAIASAFYFGASRVIAVDRLHTRLDVAQQIGAETINFDDDDPVEAIKELTGGIGVDRVIDAVGIDAEAAQSGPARSTREEKQKEREEIPESANAPGKTNNGDDELWQAGTAPSKALRWGIECSAKAGTMSIVGVYPQDFDAFPIGAAMNKNMTIKMGNCPHRKYIPKLIALANSNAVNLDLILSHTEPLTSALEAYEAFDLRAAGWLKVELLPGSHVGAAAR